MPEKVHHGKNIKRFREMLDIKQEALALELGAEWTQRKISLLEQKETIEPEVLQQIAKALKVPVKAIENFTENGAVNYFNSFHDQSLSHSNGAFGASHCTFNPLEKYIETVEDNKKLYDALLKEKDEKIALLERILTDRK
ncbi:helix-turn-helix domain-containing protein [Chitinophaga filiformis]|uniref:Helix-turn-helix domain-containing protein n=1 Tax=Chitinophaga filiformis TaxID=104663 RepID=A0ABY4HW23_CHIFI|nr:helix-turn-helix transcriptional regulator [Chitinophaga filiformis]UPK67986.1 helix-turn-helix domain-containing protein [Chitinophaga filiformis]